jgi:asparagine synthase (glutamine-hydrolysing)
MCGIAGIINKDGVPPEARLLQDMSRAIAHRGPDADGFVIDRGIGLVHRRLSIVDLSPTGSQPMTAAGEGLCIVFNGEIYNFLDIRRQIGNRWTFRGQSDTEVLLAAYHVWGRDCLSRLNGIYAFAIHDRVRRKIFIARDPFGVKPLFVVRSPRYFAFCSEIKGLLMIPTISRIVSNQSLHEFLYYGAPLGAQTMFSSISSLLAGEHLEIDESLSESSWCRDAVADAMQQPPKAFSHTELMSCLSSAVERQMVSDVPIGLLLSGGIDSSLIAAIASRSGERKISTFSVGFSTNREDTELPKARIVANCLGTDHNELLVSDSDARDVVEKLVGIYDGPFSDAANIPLYLLFRRLQGQVKVVLQGDGGDELFGGYRRYRALMVRHLLGSGGLALQDFIKHTGVDKVLLNSRRRRFLAALFEENPALCMAYLLTVETQHPSPLRLVSPIMRLSLRKKDPFQRYHDVNEDLSRVEIPQRMLWTDCRILLPDIFLTKVDRSSMACGIEARVPFLDLELARLMLPVPAGEKIRYGDSKPLLRACAKHFLPKEIVFQAKSGFGVPYGRWLREGLRDFMQDALMDQTARDIGVFDQPAIELCIRNHLSGKKDSSFLLWKMMNLAVWIRQVKVQLTD